MCRLFSFQVRTYASALPERLAAAGMEAACCVSLVFDGAVEDSAERSDSERRRSSSAATDADRSVDLAAPTEDSARALARVFSILLEAKAQETEGMMRGVMPTR